MNSGSPTLPHLPLFFTKLLQQQRHRPHSCVLYGMPNYGSGGDQVPRSQFTEDRNLYFSRSEYANTAGGGSNNANVEHKSDLYPEQGSFLQHTEHYANSGLGSSMIPVPVAQQQYHHSQRHEPSQPTQSLAPAPAQSQWQPAKKTEQAEQRTPRPSNAWIIYRSQKFRELQQDRDSQARSASTGKPRSQAVISRIISQMWANETPAIKQEFEALADAKKLEHQRMYPNYRYRPRKKVKNASSSNLASSSTTTARNSVSPNSTSGRSVKSGALGSATSSYSESSMEMVAQHGYVNGSPVRRPMEDVQRFSDLTTSAPTNTSMRDSFYRSYPQPGRRVAGDQAYLQSSSRMNGGANANPQFSNAPVGNRMHPYGERADQMTALQNAAYLQSSNRYVQTQSASTGTLVWPEGPVAHGDSRGGGGYGGIDGSRSSATTVHMAQSVASDQQQAHHHQHQHQLQHQHHVSHHHQQPQQHQHQSHLQQQQAYVQQQQGYPGNAGAEYGSNMSSSDSGYSMASRAQTSGSATPQTYPQYGESTEMPSGLTLAAPVNNEYGARRPQVQVYYKTENF